MQPYPQDGMAMQHMLMHGGADGMPQFQGGVGHHAGQFPQEFYNNPHGQTMQRASLIQRRKDKEEKFHRKMKLIDMKVKEEKKEATFNVGWLLGMGVVHTFALCIIIIGNSWSHKAFKGIGIKVCTIRTSLFMLEVNIACGKNWLEDKLCVLGTRMNGDHTLHQAAQLACNISPAACRPIEDIRKSSLIIFFTFGIAIIVQVFGVIFLYAYWYQQHVPRLKKGSLAAFVASPVIAGIGLMTWSMVVPSLADIPRGWSAMSSIATGTQLFAFQPLNAFPFGWTWFAAIGVLLSMVVWLALWPAMFKKHEGEEEAEEEEERVKDMMENEAVMTEYHQDHIHPGAADSMWGGTQYAPDGTWAGGMQHPPPSGGYHDGMQHPPPSGGYHDGMQQAPPGGGYPGGMQQPPPGAGGMHFGLPQQQQYGYHQ